MSQFNPSFSQESITKAIINSLPDAFVEIKDMTGTGDHLEICVTSPSFAGKLLFEQHQVVMKALSNEFAKGLHAVKLHTKIPHQS